MEDLARKATPHASGNSDRIVTILKSSAFKEYVETKSDVARRLGVLVDHVKTKKHDIWVKDPRFAFFAVGREEGTHKVFLYPSFGPNGRAAEFVSDYLPNVDPSLPPEQIYDLALTTYLRDLEGTYRFEEAIAPERKAVVAPPKKRTFKEWFAEFMS